MRASFLSAVPVLAVLSAFPAAGQVTARVNVDIPVGRRAPTIHAPSQRQIIVRDYDTRRYGAWESSYDQWSPETVYYYDGLYYDYPVVEYAQPVVVYRYRNEVFFAPRERGFESWRQQRQYRTDGRDFRYENRSVRPVPRNDWEQHQYRPVPRNSREYQPGTQVGGDRRGEHRDMAKPQQGREENRRAPSAGGRDDGRSRPRPH